MKVEIAFLLVIAPASLKRLVALVGFEHPTQFVDFFYAHAFSGQATGHAFQGFTDFVKLDQLGMIERHHPRPDVRHAHQQALAFQAVDGLAQRAAADAIGTGQLWFGDFTARRDIAFDDGRLNTAEDVLGKRLRIVLGRNRGIELIQHIVDTLKANAAKTSEYARLSQRIIGYC
ncbi:hypothetical protein D3C87_1396690 [compost metagenome]